MTLKAGGGTLPLLNEPGILQNSSIALIESLLIPAFTEVIVLSCNVNRLTNSKSNDVSIQRSASLLDKYGILGANYVTKTKDNLVPVRFAKSYE